MCATLCRSAHELLANKVWITLPPPPPPSLLLANKVLINAISRSSVKKFEKTNVGTRKKLLANKVLINAISRSSVKKIQKQKGLDQDYFYDPLHPQALYRRLKVSCTSIES
jgi:hypothetical protein